MSHAHAPLGRSFRLTLCALLLAGLALPACGDGQTQGGDPEVTPDAGGGGGGGGGDQDAGAVADTMAPADTGGAADSGAPPASGPSSMGGGGGTGMKTWKVGTTTYVSYVPDSYDDSQAWPMLLHLHGQGLTAAQEVARFKSNADSMKFIVIGQQAKDTGSGWSESEFPAMTSVLKDARKHWNVANDGVYMSGYSAGAGIGITYATFFDPADEAMATFYISGFAGFCGPWQPSWDGGGSRKVAIYGASNKSDPNYGSVQSMVKYYAGKSFPAQWQDETGSTSGHTYTSKSITDAMTWLFANKP